MIESARRPHSPAPGRERGAALGLLPLLVTAGYYALPAPLQEVTVWQFLPQASAYACLAWWWTWNRDAAARLGLRRPLSPGIAVGLAVGLALGALNTSVILSLAPRLGIDVAFLADTPHAKVPVLVMVPWFIGFIAAAVELNFRGFLLGRLLALTTAAGIPGRSGSAVAVGGSALAFAFDPFLVATFRELHWIAVWDGLIWGAVWVRTKNLYATIVAHATEVIVTYLAVRSALGGG